MHFDLVKIWEDMDWMARGVVFALVAMALAGLAVFIERIVALARSRKQSRLFAGEAVRLLDEDEHKKLLDRVPSFQHSHLAQMLGPSLEVYLKHKGDQPGRGLPPVELAKRELDRRKEEASQDIRKGFSVLATVGSIAPFVGLLGTVVGIIAAFTKISTTGSGGLGSVAGGISEALVVTALGLIVAIPAVLAFNYLSGRADQIELGLTSSAGQFIDHIEHAYERDTADQRMPMLSKKESHGRHADAPAA